MYCTKLVVAAVAGLLILAVMVPAVTAASHESTSSVEDEDQDEEYSHFAQLLTQYIEDTEDEADGPFGLAVASFVHDQLGESVLGTQAALPVNPGEGNASIPDLPDDPGEGNESVPENPGESNESVPDLPRDRNGSTLKLMDA